MVEFWASPGVFVEILTYVGIGVGGYLLFRQYKKRKTTLKTS